MSDPVSLPMLMAISRHLFEIREVKILCEEAGIELGHLPFDNASPQIAWWLAFKEAERQGGPVLEKLLELVLQRAPVLREDPLFAPGRAVRPGMAPAMAGDGSSTLLYIGSNPRENDREETSPPTRFIYNEISAIQHLLRSSAEPRRFRLQIELGLTLDELSEMFRECAPVLVHFSSRFDFDMENVGVPLLEDVQRTVDVELTIDRFAERFKALERGVRCLLITGCNSPRLPQMLQRRLPCVVSSINSVTDDETVRFTRFFYQELFRGKGFHLAFQAARSAVRLQRPGRGSERWELFAADQAARESTLY